MRLIKTIVCVCVGYVSIVFLQSLIKPLKLICALLKSHILIALVSYLKMFKMAVWGTLKLMTQYTQKDLSDITS